MAYTKQNFENGQVLTAEHLNHMEQGIVDAVSVTPQTLTDGQKAQARGNIGAVAKSGISLGVHSDGLVYVFVDGSPVGDGIELATAGDVIGYVDENNNVILTGALADGTYNIKYEMEDGSTVDIGDLVLDTNVYYSVTNTLTNCVSNNSAIEVIEGESYSATITANDGYELSSVVVTMGSVDITADAVIDGYIISIQVATGDIVITAVAEETIVTPTYTNLADPTSADWKEGYRISLSAGTASACDGHVVTNFIPATQGDVLRVKGLAIVGSVNSQYAKICRYDANKTNLSGGYGSEVNARDNYGLKVTVDGDISTYTVMELNDGSIPSTADKTAYIRIDGIPMDGYTSEDVIITINEEIV
jgi:hypothetical protein